MRRQMTTPASKTNEAGNRWEPSLDTYESSLRYAADTAAQFIADMAAFSRPYWLTFSGVNGCGKTMLCAQIVQAARPLNPGEKSLWIPVDKSKPRRPRCVWFDEKDFATRLRAGEYDLPDYLADDFLLVFDELGFARDPSSFIADGIARLCQSRRDKWTVFATNLSLEEIAQRIDARITSRLIRDDNRFITIKAGDYALRRLPDSH